MTIFHAQSLFTGEEFLNDRYFSVDNGVFTLTEASTDAVKLDGLVVPGFIDVQVNGGGGVLFNRTSSVAGVKKILLAHAKYGTTAMLPTLITDTVEVMRQAADVIAKAIAQQTPGIIGIHFEGPHLSIAKKGTHCLSPPQTE